VKIDSHDECFLNASEYDGHHEKGEWKVEQEGLDEVFSTIHFGEESRVAF